MNEAYIQRLISSNNLNEEEMKIIEPYRVRRAVLMAAGLGTRLRPLTYDTPKPLLEVGGKRIIDTIIDALTANDINEIYIVRGYMAESFDVLLEKYPFLHFINNLCYNEGNNILSACVAGNLIESAYVMPADLYIANSDVFPKYQIYSNVLGYPISVTDDWCIEAEGDIIKRLSPGGQGANCYKDTGVFYWNSTDGNRLYRQIYEVCGTDEGRKRYWSNVPFVLYKADYEVHIRLCGADDVIEIDTVSELSELRESLRQGDKK